MVALDGAVAQLANGGVLSTLVERHLIKAVGRKPNNALMRYRELAYRAAPDAFDCSLAKRLLGWTPVADRETFLDLGIRRALAGKGTA